MPTTETDALTLSMFRAAVGQLTITTLHITHAYTDHEDEFGAPCEHCADQDATVTMNAYLLSLSSGENVMLTGCAPCLIHAVASDADPEATVRLETYRARTAPVGRRPASNNTNWQAGRDAANLLMDLGILNATDLHRFALKAERAANTADRRGDNDTWIRAHGLYTMLRERIQDMTG